MKGWVRIPTEDLRAARSRLGLSYDNVARHLNLTTKTYTRWEKTGRINTQYLDRLSEILELKIDRPEAIHVTIAEPPDALPMLQALDHRLGALEAEIVELQRLLRALLSASGQGDDNPEQQSETRRFVADTG